jgi:hypothetical protein
MAAALRTLRRMAHSFSRLRSLPVAQIPGDGITSVEVVIF